MKLLSIGLVAGLYAGALMAQAPAVPCVGKLTEGHLEKLLSSGVSQARVEQFVRTCGIGFELTPAAERRVRRRGGGGGVWGRWGRGVWRKCCEAGSRKPGWSSSSGRVGSGLR